MCPWECSHDFLGEAPNVKSEVIQMQDPLWNVLFLCFGVKETILGNQTTFIVSGRRWNELGTNRKLREGGFFVRVKKATL